jgi:protein-L-isoaspartate O-methyltransferase
MRARRLAGAAALATLGAALWWRNNPSACPYGQRFWVQAPHPIVTRERLYYVLRPQPGERVLEIGPGTGYYTLDMAEWVGPEGRIEIFDLQQEFLAHTMRRAAERGLENVVPTQGDATALPY